MGGVSVVTYTLHQGDCLDVMREMLDDDTIDLTVTSPPYDNLREYGKDFDAASFDWRGIIVELYRVTKPGGVVVWVVADATINGSETGTSFRQALWAMDCGFNLHDTMIYQKYGSGLPHNDGRYGQSFEYIFVWSKGKPQVANIPRFPLSEIVKPTTRRRANGKIYPGTYNVGGGVLPNVRKYTRKTRQDHPAPFPESLAKDHIISWSNPGQTVFDPMMGSGTTGKMAVLNQRNFVGVELDPGYFAIAEQRIAKAAKMAAGEFVPITGNADDTSDLPLFQKMTACQPQQPHPNS